VRLLAIAPPTGEVSSKIIDRWDQAGAVGQLGVLLRTPTAPIASLIDPRFRGLVEGCLSRRIPLILSCEGEALWRALKDPGPQRQAILDERVAGVQIRGNPSPQLLREIRRQLPDRTILGRSCHTQLQASAVRLDYTCVAPIFAPSTLQPGKQKKPAGLQLLRRWSRVLGSQERLFALGGMSASVIEPCLQAGAHGIAGIQAFFGTRSHVDRELGSMVPLIRRFFAD